MRRGKMRYKGETNNLYEIIIDDNICTDLLEFETTNRVTIRDGTVDNIEKKAEVNSLLSTLLFKRLNDIGIQTHYLAEGTTSTSKIVWNCEMIKIKAIVRNSAAGCFCRRYAVKEGTEFKKAILELFFRGNTLYNPFMEVEEIVNEGICSFSEIVEIKDYTYTINKEAKRFFRELGLYLIDLTLEFGRRYDGLIIPAGEISLDTCHLIDVYGNRLDTDVFREGGSKVEVSAIYKKMLEILRKMQ